MVLYSFTFAPVFFSFSYSSSDETQWKFYGNIFSLRLITKSKPKPQKKNLFPSFDDSDLEGKRRIEISPGVLYNIQEISSRIGQQGGNALIIDYGHQGEKEDTLRGFRNHKLVSVLEQPGDTDITV